MYGNSQVEKDLPLELLHMMNYSHQAESGKPEQEDSSTAK